VAKINALGDGNGVISDSFSNFYLSSVNSLQELTFLILSVISMLENIVTALDGKITIMNSFWWF